MAGRGLRVVVADALGIILLVCSALVGRALFDVLGAQWDFLAESSGMAALVAWGVVWAMCRGAFFVLLAGSFAYAVGRFRQRRIAAAIPLLFNVGVLLVATFYPFTSKWIDTRFEDHFSEYTAVVALVEDGTLAPGPNSDTIALPANLAHLSAGGEIRVDTTEGVTRVFFFTFRGMLDHFSGFMYRSDDSPPRADDFLGIWDEVHRMRARWYFCASG